MHIYIYIYTYIYTVSTYVYNHILKLIDVHLQSTRMMDNVNVSKYNGDISWHRIWYYFDANNNIQHIGFFLKMRRQVPKSNYLGIMVVFLI